MSQSIRQSDLFAGSDWQVLYRAFTDVNFNASDPPSINRALRSYIQTNYPENFNDWIESSEFVALIDLLSWLAGTLAFKTDINAREAFLETAETRESILRLARFISYNPHRNQCAQGLVKLVEVSTDDDVMDGFGTNLNGATIQWDNPNDPDWFERFTLILNSAFISTNQFGVPLKTGVVSNSRTQLYRLNNRISESNLGFKATVAGSSMDFELINADFDDGGGFYEREPNFENAMHLFYRNDGNGNASSATGFFMMFKQGTLQRNVFNIPTPVENNVLDLNTQNVNDTDVWVQSVTDQGDVIQSWNKVPAIFNENITYNNYDPDTRNIFSVLTRDNDQISIRFSDGRFGAVPTGNVRVFYRVSNGLQYQIRPTDMARVKIPIPYYNRKGVKRTITLTFSLQKSVSNSTPRETDEQVKARAPSVYATQNRMVSGEDYNTFPLQSNLAVKLKAINRIYSGHSRFIDLNDPTGNYQDVNVFSDDGIFFKEPYDIYTEVPMALGSSAGDIVSLYIQPVLNRQEVENHAGEILLDASYDHAIGESANGIVWTATDQTSFVNTGYLSNTNTYTVEGATAQFDVGNGKLVWATIASMGDDPTTPPPTGSAGPVTLSQSIPSGSYIKRVIPRFNSGLDANASVEIQNYLRDNNSFTLWFDFSVDPATTQSSWVVSPETVTSTMFKVMTVTYVSGGLWSIVASGVRYVFESLKKVQWYNDGRRTVDAETGVETMDYVRVLKTNEDLHTKGFPLAENYDLSIKHIYVNRDGSVDPKRITVSFADYNLNGYADNPETFDDITDPHATGRYLFWKATDQNGYVPLTRVVHVFDNEDVRRDQGADVNLYPVGTVAFQLGANGVEARENTFWVKTAATTNGEQGWVIQRPGAYSFGIGRGPNVAASWTGAPNAQMPGNDIDSPDWREWWDEIKPPVWVTPEGQLVNVNEETFVSGTVFAVDPQNLPIRYLVDDDVLPEGITIDPVTGVYSGAMPLVADVANTADLYSFTIKATNGALSTERQFMMRSAVAPEEPQWVTLSQQLGVFMPGDQVNIELEATDPDNRLLTFSKVRGSLPQGLLLTPDGIITGTVAPVTAEALADFTVRVTNGLSFADRPFTILATNEPAPVFLLATQAISGIVDLGTYARGSFFGPMQINASSGGDTSAIYQEIRDANGNQLSYGDFSMLPQGLQFSDGKFSAPYPSTQLRGAINNAATLGAHVFTIRAFVGQLGSNNYTDQKFKITITA